MMAKAADPTREVAIIALKGSAYPTETMRQVLAYAFGQLCWSMSDPELEALLADLRHTFETGE